jgi:carboxynorspermidine decarboxylase
MAMKAFSMWSVFPIINKTLQGVCASSPWEARLGYEEFGGEVHSFAAAFKESDIVELLEISNHLVFNSLNQFGALPATLGAEGGAGVHRAEGQPEHSEGHTAIYDPCALVPDWGYHGRSLKAAPWPVLTDCTSTPSANSSLNRWSVPQRSLRRSSASFCRR